MILIAEVVFGLFPLKKLAHKHILGLYYPELHRLLFQKVSEKAIDCLVPKCIKSRQIVLDMSTTYLIFF